ncbi:MAG: putative Bacterial sugar transferase family protein, partial [Tardiphaga sp.]|nr:putative Bacterial sugar transferase family protein [Tardiphaga sp.]
MEPINARSMLNAATAEATMAGAPVFERRRRLSRAALAVTNQKVRKAFSPVVIAGCVRLADFLLLSVIGVAIYLGYAAQIDGFNWSYIIAILGMTATAVICFQASGIYDIQVFRGHVRQTTRMI